jgi:hypothetical protein
MATLIGSIGSVNWVLTKDILAALLMPMLAVFVISQHRFNRRRSLQATADKRQAIFVAMMRLVSYLIIEGRKDRLAVCGIGERVADCTGMALGSAALFDPENRHRLIEFSQKVYKMATLVAETEGRHNTEIDGILEWLENEHGLMTQALSGDRPALWT